MTFFYSIVMIYLFYKAFRHALVSRCFESISKGENKMISFKRTVDKLGRLVIPKELREQYGFGENTPVEITPVTKNMLKGIEGVLPSIFVYISCILVLLAL